MSSSDGFTYSQPSGGSSEKLDLNNEQIHALLNKLSSDEQKELTDMMRNCTTEVTTTRGLPVTAAVLGSLYFARTRLPAQYHFGPKGWPFYAIMGIASLTATNFMFMGMCRDRIKPRIDQLWRKYDLAKSSVSYEEIRRQNRGAAGNVQAPMVVAPTEQAPVAQKNPYDYTYSTPLSDSSAPANNNYDSFTSYKPLIGETSEFYQEPTRPRRPPPPNPNSPFASDDSGLFISGTPSGQKPSSGDQGYTFS